MLLTIRMGKVLRGLRVFFLVLEKFNFMDYLTSVCLFLLVKL